MTNMIEVSGPMQSKGKWLWLKVQLLLRGMGMDGFGTGVQNFETGSVSTCLYSQ
jgi:hypothetical protein